MKKLCLSILILIFFSGISFAEDLKLGAKIPELSAKSYTGKTVSFGDYRGKTIVLEWFNMGCPFVRKHYNSKHMQALQEKYTAKGVVWLTVASTTPAHKNFMNGEQLARVRDEQHMKSTDILVDDRGALGKLFGATTTPDMVIIDPSGKIVYMGAIDDSPDTGSDPSKAVNYVANALDSMISGKDIEVAQTEPYGCSIKYAS